MYPNRLLEPGMDIMNSWLYLFRLTKAPALFIDLMNRVFRAYLNQFVISFIDDILVYSKSHEEHIVQLGKVLQTLREHHLYAMFRKCEFFLIEVVFLGHVMSEKGISIDLKKIEAVLKWKAPNSVTKVQIFLGLEKYYRILVENFSIIGSPITKLTRK